MIFYDIFKLIWNMEYHTGSNIDYEHSTSITLRTIKLFGRFKRYGTKNGTNLGRRHAGDINFL